MIIGKYYEPLDNSFCINCRTGKNALLVRSCPGDTYYIGPDKEERNANFEIVTEPYLEKIYFCNKWLEETFINVKSSVTGNLYRVLYFDKRVI